MSSIAILVVIGGGSSFMVLMCCIVLMLTYNQWCDTVKGCDWFPFLRKKEDDDDDDDDDEDDDEDDDNNSPQPGPGGPAPDGIVNDGCWPEKPRWDPVKKECIAAPVGEGCDGSIKPDEGCTCLKPIWDPKLKQCRARRPPTNPQPPPPSPVVTVDCKQQATDNTGYFVECRGTSGKQRDYCIGKNKKICMQHPGATW